MLIRAEPGAKAVCPNTRAGTFPAIPLPGSVAILSCRDDRAPLPVAVHHKHERLPVALAQRRRYDGVDHARTQRKHDIAHVERLTDRTRWNRTEFAALAEGMGAVPITSAAGGISAVRKRSPHPARFTVPWSAASPNPGLACMIPMIGAAGTRTGRLAARVGFTPVRAAALNRISRIATGCASASNRVLMSPCPGQTTCVGRKGFLAHAARFAGTCAVVSARLAVDRPGHRGSIPACRTTSIRRVPGFGPFARSRYYPC